MWLQKYFSPIESKRSQSSSVSIWSAGHQFQSDRQQFSLQVKLTKYKWKVTGDTKAPTEMDASCGKIIATTKKVIRVTAYMHIRVGKLDVPMSIFQNLVVANLETQKHPQRPVWQIPAVPCKTSKEKEIQICRRFVQTIGLLTWHSLWFNHLVLSTFWQCRSEIPQSPRDLPSP